jgi:integrase
MATLTIIKGRPVIQVQAPSRQRFTISLGGYSERQARTIKSHIEHIQSAAASNTALPPETAAWLRGIGEDLHAKLAKVHLVAPRISREATQLGPFFESFVSKRNDLKPNSLRNFKNVQRFAVKHFGADRALGSINRGDAADWKRALLDEYAEATVAMHVKKMRQLYADAIDHHLVSENPFMAVKPGSMSNADRMYYVPAADMQKVIDACPNQEWRTLFAIARFAGLRIPSEIRHLQFEDIDWEHDRFTVLSPKTERHERRDKRIVPIFPAIRPFLLASQEQAEPGTTHVFPTLRGENLRTTAVKIIKRAGLIAWPRIFQNLRSSCETDLATRFPLHVACAWIGNSTGVAMRSYLQVHDAFFSAASESAASGVVVSAGQHQTKPELIMQNHSDSPRNPAKSMPPVGDELERISNGKTQEAHEAMQQALHPTLRNPKFKGEPDVDGALKKIRRAAQGGGH